MKPGRGRVAPWLIAGYIVALGISNAVRSTRPPGEPADPDESLVTVTVARGEPVRIAFRDHNPLAESPPVVLLHGSPGDNGEVAGIGQRLGRTRRAIAPDLPGFGGSTREVPSYSVEAHAGYLLALLDSLGISRAHLLGFSMGGGVAISLARQAPERVASLTLLSAIGAQEYELLGSYHLNHAIHGLQLGLIWAIEELLPHFGRLDGGFLTREYARNFYDTDQRPLRAALTEYNGPALIIQGRADNLVDPAVAIESHRLLPQSELAMFEGPEANHFIAFRQTDSVAAVAAGFLDRVDRGEAATRQEAPLDRVERALAPFDPGSIPPAIGVALVVLLLLIAASTFVSEDLACIATGLLVARGTVSFVAGTGACLVGIFLGDIWLFLMGRWLGRPALGRAPLRWFVKPAAVDRSARWFAKRGAWLILATRFVPGTRLPTYFTAGVLHTSVVAFLGAFLLAAAVWTPLLVGASSVFGDQVLTTFVSYQDWALPALFLMALGLFVLFKLVVPLFSWRGRRLLLSRWRRLSRWEFWPRWAFYPPLVCYIGWLAIKHRGLRLFTAVNPAIPGGGFVGESKAQILLGLSHQPERVARWRLIPEASPADRAGMVRRFMADVAISYPVVLKPDVGERGGGVGILESDAELDRYLARTREPLIAQEYVGGVEFGIFYYRIPGATRGTVFAITDKRFPSVVGDGVHSLERLILADDRAVSMAPFFLEQHAERLDWVPPPGATVPLVVLGTHSRGSAFFDGEWIRTPALEAAIDELSQGFEGFWFGRYDVRAPSADALMAGTDFKVLELNGATAEATSIYDPKNGIGTAYRILRQQWRVLFEIAAKNVAAGAKPASWRELKELIDRHRRSVHAHVDAT